MFYRPKLERLEDRDLLTYAIADLGALTGRVSTPFGINAGGDVVGASQVFGSYGTHAFQALGGNSMTELPDVYPPPDYAWGINPSGEISGCCYLASSGQHLAYLDIHGVMWTIMPFGYDQNYYYTSAGRGIDDAGDVVGDFNSTQYPGYPRAFYYYAKIQSVTILGTLGGARSYGYDINNVGQIVGSSDADADGHLRPFLYQGGVMTNLGSLDPSGQGNTEAYAINDAGQVAGYSEVLSPSWHQRAFLYTGGSMKDLGTLPGSANSKAYGLNGHGDVVGIVNRPLRAFLYTGGVMYDLNDLVPPDSGWKLIGASAINDAGQIAAQGVNAYRQVHALLLTPTSAPSWEILAAMAQAARKEPGW
jgi:probable HAF family extracellular repeat protein